MHDPEFDPPVAAPKLEPGALNAAFAWFRNHQPAALALAACFQLLVLAGIVVASARPWQERTTVLLRVVPVDPRDLMRGDYVTLSYDLNRVPNGRIPGITNVGEEVGRAVYVELLPEPDGRHYHGGAISLAPPRAGHYLRGTILNWVRLSFGIESYFVQEGKGHDYEKAILDHNLSAEVAVGRDGRGTVQRLVIE